MPALRNEGLVQALRRRASIRVNVFEDRELEIARAGRPHHFHKKIREAHERNIGALGSILRLHLVHQRIEITVESNQRQGNQ